MTASPWLQPFPELPDAGANAPVSFPWIGTGGNFFGPREKVWIDSFGPTVEGGDPGYIRIARSNTLPSLEVTFNILADSTAQKNVDYLDPNPIVVFEPGQTYVDVPIVAIDDAIPEATESVRFVLWDTSRVGTWTPSDITSLVISDNDQGSRMTTLELLPPVDGQEGLRDGKIRARRSGSTQEPLQAPFKAFFGNGLIDDRDVRLSPKQWNAKSSTGFFYFPAGESLASVGVLVLDDTEAENTEWMDIQLLPSPNGEYLLGGKPQQTLRIFDNDSGSGKRPTDAPGITQITLSNDTGSSPSDRVTWDERLEISIDGKLLGGRLQTEFDWTGDFIPDTSISVHQSPSTFGLDPRKSDPRLADQHGLRIVRYRSNWYTKDDVLIQQSPWEDFAYQVVENPDSGPLRLSDLRLKVDTGNSTDRISSNPTVCVSILGQYPHTESELSSIRIEWDQTNDGRADHSALLPTEQRSVDFDPRTVDPAFARFPGPRTLRVRLLDDTTQEPLGSWETLEFTIPNTPPTPWIVSEITHRPPGLLQGRVIDPSLQAMNPNSGGLDLSASQWLASQLPNSNLSNSYLSVQIAKELEDQAIATVPVEQDFSFEVAIANLTPGTHTLRLRAQQWSSELSMFLTGNWTEYRLEVSPAEPPSIPTARLRNDTGTSNLDRSTSDPTILIDVVSNASGSGLMFLDIDTNSDSQVDHVIPVHREAESNSSLIVYRDETLSAGPQHYRFRSRNVDPLSDWEATGEWTDFHWTYAPAKSPSLSIALLRDDGASSTDRITSISTLVGQFIPSDDVADAESSLVQIDWDSDGRVDDSVRPQPDGSFTIRPSRNPIGPRRVSARIEWTDPFRETIHWSPWTTFDYQLTNPSDSAPSIDALRLLFDTGINPTDRVSSSSTITGTVLKELSAGDLIEVDRNGDGLTDEQVSLDPSGRFYYSPMGLSFGAHVLAFRTRGLQAVPNGFSRSPWQLFDLTYVASTLEPVVIDSIGLVNDSGIANDLRSEQGVIAGRVSSPSGIAGSVVLVDRDQDRQADQTIAVDSEGRFLFDPKLQSTGQFTFSFKPMRLYDTAVDESPTSRWRDFTWVIEDQPDVSPELYGLAYVPSDSLKGAQIVGKVRSQSSVETIRVDIDSDGDGHVDRTVASTAYGDFSIGLDDVSPGTYAYRLRAVATGSLIESLQVGSWQTLAFELSGPPTTQARIEELKLRVDDGFDDSDRITSDPSLVGRVSRSSAYGMLVLEFDTDGDAIVDDRSIAAEDLLFHYTPTQIAPGAFHIRARTMELMPTGNVLRSEWSELRGTLVSKTSGALRIESIELLGDFGQTPDDLRSSHPMIIGFVGNASQGANQWVLDIDLDRDGSSDQSELFWGNHFSVTPRIAQHGMVDLGLRIRSKDSSEASPWYSLGFLYHPEPRSREADAWVSTYRTIATAMNQGASQHIQGLGQAITKLAQDRQTASTEREVRNQVSISHRLLAIRESASGYWSQIAEAQVQLSKSQREALDALQERLESTGSPEVMLPLPEELAILWPSDPLPVLPYLDSEWFAAEETLPRPPVLAPLDRNEPSIASFARSTTLSEALNRDDLSDIGVDLNDHQAYQSDLQTRRSKLITDYRSLQSQSNARIVQAQEIYDLVMSDAESAYRRAMQENGKAMDGFFAEDYSAIFQQFAQDTQASQEFFQARRKATEDRYRAEMKLVSESHAEQMRTAARNRDASFEAAIRELASVLNRVPPPEWPIVKAAIVRHAQLRFDAEHLYDKTVLSIRIEEQSASYKIQREQFAENAQAQREYAIEASEIQRVRDAALAEQKFQFALRRANAAERLDRATELAGYNLKVARDRAWAELEQARNLVERDRRIGFDGLMRRFDLAHASALVATLTQIDQLLATPDSNAHLKKAKARQELLDAWDPKLEQSSIAQADVWKQFASAKTTAELNRRIENLADEHARTNERLDATWAFRKEHAALVQSHAKSLAQIRHDTRSGLIEAEHLQSLDTGLMGISYLEGESSIASDFRQRSLNAMVYTPPEPMDWLGGWGWINDDFLIAASGSVTIPAPTAFQLTHDQSVATAELVYRSESSRIGIDHRYFQQRDTIEAKSLQEVESLRVGSLGAEVELQRRFHLASARADRKQAVGQVDRKADWDSAVAIAEKDYRIAGNDLVLRIEQQLAIGRSAYMRSMHGIHLERSIEEWDTYLSGVQKWRDSDPTEWTDYILADATAARRLGVQRAQLTRGLADSLAEQKDRDDFITARIDRLADSENATSDFEYRRSKLVAERELGRSIADAKFVFAEKTAGVLQSQDSGWNFAVPTHSTPTQLELRLSASRVTEQAARLDAQSQLHASTRRAEAQRTRSRGIYQIQLELVSSGFDWAKYQRGLELLDRLFHESLQHIQAELDLSQSQSNLELREKRAEIVRQAQTELASIQVTEARWAWKEDIPRLAAHRSSQRDMAQAIQAAEEHFAQQMASLQTSRSESTSRTDFRRGVDARVVQYGAIENENNLRAHQESSAADALEAYGSQVLDSKNAYQKRSLDRQSLELEKVYRRLDPHTKQLLNLQVSGLLLRQASIREANAWKYQNASVLRRSDASDRSATQRETERKIRNAQEQFEYQSADLQRAQAVEKVRLQGVWKVASQQATNAVRRTETILESVYDQQTQETLDGMNQNLLEQQKVQAEQIGEAWKSYYLAMHPESGPIHVSLRREYDGWFGLRVRPNLAMATLWRSQTMALNGLADLRNHHAAFDLREKLETLSFVQQSNRTELQVEFALGISDPKVQRIEALGRAQRELLQASSNADRQQAQLQHESAMDLQNQLAELQASWTVRRDQMEMELVQSVQSRTGLTAERAEAIERKFLEDSQRASLRYERDWALAQSEYHRVLSRKRSDLLEQSAHDDLRSKALAAHAEGYAQWMEEVSSDYVASVEAGFNARSIDQLANRAIEHNRATAERVANEGLARQSDAFLRESEREKAELEYVAARDQAAAEYQAIQDRRQIDLEYQLLVLSNQAVFLQATERSESVAQVMKLRGYPVANQIREKSLLVAEARYTQVLADADALMDWQRQVAEESLQIRLEQSERTDRLSTGLGRLEHQRQRSLTKFEQERSDAIAQARYDHQLQTIQSEGDLARAQGQVQAAWLLASCQEKIIAREHLQDSVPGAWSDFLVGLAEHEYRMLGEWNAAEQRWIDSRSDSDSQYQREIGQAQLTRSLRLSQAQNAAKASETQQEQALFESKSQALVAFLKELESPAQRYIEQATELENASTKSVALAERDWRVDLDATRYQQRLEDARRMRQSQLDRLARTWNRDYANAMANKRTSESDAERASLVSQIESEFRFAQQTRDAAKELIDREADAYRDSERSWAMAEREYAQSTADLQRGLAERVDQEQASLWSEFFLDITKAKAESIEWTALAIEGKVLAESQEQAEHEKQQGVLQWVWDLGQWTASDLARRAVVALDWRLEGTKIQAIRAMAQATLSNQNDLEISSPDALIADLSRLQHFTSADRRYELLFSEQIGLNEAIWNWQDTGFLQWIRSPQEQFAESYWSLKTIVHARSMTIESPRVDPVQMPEGSLDPLVQIAGIPSKASTPTIRMMPQTDQTQEALVRLDREFSASQIEWLDSHGRVLRAMDRPDFSELFADRTIVWDLQTSPIRIAEQVPESQERFFVQDQDQWREFMNLANYSYEGPSAVVTSPVVRGWLSKYQRHVGDPLDTAAEGLRGKYEGSNTINHRDRVVESKGVAYWQHTVGVEPSRNEGPFLLKSVRTRIGVIDRNGWVYLPSGQRVLYSALVKWADELTMGSSREINRLIDGLISPFSIETESRQYGIFIGGTGMHMFGIGNVERLYNMYQGTKFYYGGVGNPAEYDSKNRVFADNAAGYGWTEILDRIEADVLAHYRGWQKLHVFGWSRGASMGIEFARRMGRYGIEVEFLGLFDPVYSYVLPGQSSSLIQWSSNGRRGNYVTAIPTTNVKAIGALYAIHEDRSFFPATKLTHDGMTRMKLMKSPGAHGEVGGHFLSNLPLQRMNLRAMIEFAILDGHVRFEFEGIEQDLVQIYSSPLTKKLQIQAISEPMTVIESRGKAIRALEISSWQAMRAEDYYRELVECSAQGWKPSGFGFQKGRITGAVAYGLEFVQEILPPLILPPMISSKGVFSNGRSIGPIRQTAYSHYRRDLQWCELELWDLELMQDPSGKNWLSEPQKERVRFFYQLKIDPKTGDWLFNGRPISNIALRGGR
ncbi:MAG: DUF2235 domain-containing protein [Planctomycetota bacterium]|nr:DUF2235 domain-containing protein [Planctomycetota bacterium]